MKIINKPNKEEFPINEPQLADLIPGDGRLLEHLLSNIKTTTEFVLSLRANKLLYKYADGKWTIKEIISHLIDMERIYMYRSLRFARNDQTILSGFDADYYALFSGANERNIADLLGELEATRNCTIKFLAGLTEDGLLKSGIINGETTSVRALAYHIAGHELHHLNIIKERYL